MGLENTRSPIRDMREVKNRMRSMVGVMEYTSNFFRSGFPEGRCEIQHERFAGLDHKAG
jgi:hypothetical protein